MSCYAKTPDCHSEPTFLDGLTKNLYVIVTFKILRGSVYASPSQNDKTYFSFARGEELFSATFVLHSVSEEVSVLPPLPLSLL